MKKSEQIRNTHEMKKINSQYCKSNLFLSHGDFNVDDWSFLGRIYRVDADRRSKRYVRLYEIKLTWTFKLKVECEWRWWWKAPHKNCKERKLAQCVADQWDLSKDRERVKHDKGSIYQERTNTVHISNQHQST